MFEEAHESTEGFFYRCPGMECVDFATAPGKTWEEKAKDACTACKKCNGNFPINPDDVRERGGDLDSLIAEVEKVIRTQDAHLPADIDDYTIYRLVIVYREVEKQIQQIQALRMQSFIRAWMTPKE